MLEPIFSTLSFYFNLKTTVCHSLHIKRHGHIFLSFHLLIHFLHHLSIDFISMFFRFKDNKGKPDCLITVCSSHFSESTCFLITLFLYSSALFFGTTSTNPSTYFAILTTSLIYNIELILHKSYSY